jgi:conjugative relaxase-like TrwC/TraI family protein
MLGGESLLTISTGYDPGYLTRAVATGRENYYLSAVAEHGEPPGIWTGMGCPGLGLAVGSEVDPKVMERLYGSFLDPRDPDGTARLGRAPSGFESLDDKIAGRISAMLAAEPDATPERRDELIMRALSERRAAVFFFDVTFSVPKSVSLLHASLQLRAQQARGSGQAVEAEAWEQRALAVWDAIMAGNEAMLKYLQREAGYSRAGYHSKDSGRFVDAHEWVVASFPQHTSRDGDPQLHVHNAVLNRAVRDDPLAAEGERRAWRTLDGAGLYAARPAAAAIAERTLAEELTARLGVEILARPDGNGWEIAGIGDELRDLFSSRRRAITPRVAQLAGEYERKHGRAPNARAVWSMAQFVTLDSRQPKAHSAPSREALLARWEAQSRRAEAQALSAIPDAALGRLEPGVDPAGTTDAQVDHVLVAAVADAVRAKPAFSRYELIRMINRHLPGWLGGLPGGQVTALLEELADRAAQPGGPCGILRLTAPQTVPVPGAYQRADGLSLWRRHGADLFTTRGQLDTEARLLRAAARAGAPALAPDHAARALGANRARVEHALWREHAPPGAGKLAQEGASEPLSRGGLTDDQVQAAHGILTSGRAIDILVGPAGTGKTRIVAVIAGIWQQAGTGRVIGLTTSTSAAHVLASEGLAESHNIAGFLGKIKDSDETRGHLPVQPGDLLVVDEASMVTTADLAAIEEIATRCGAKILLTGDTAQLSAPEAGGAMRLLAGEHGYYQLGTVQRFEHAWEAAASLRLRAGDVSVLAEYDRRGRILDGTREEMTAAAVSRWLADHLSGQETLLLAATNAQAADLARRARDKLAALGRVGNDEVIELADGNLAGPGDLIIARHNERIQAGEPGRFLANRDLLQFEAWAQRRGERVAVVRRRTGPDPRTGQPSWTPVFQLSLAYLRQHVQLGYAGNVHIAQSRTVGTGHLVVDETTGREALYVGMSRGRERNTAYVITERARAAGLTPRPRAAPELLDPAAGLGGRPGKIAVLASALERDQGDLTATEAMRNELDRAASLATLAPIWAGLTRASATRRYENIIRSLLSPADWQLYLGDAERGTLARLMRAAALAGHDIDAVLRLAAGRRDFAGARSVAAVLHARVRQIVGGAEPVTTGTYADRTPEIADPEAARFAAELARAMDARTALLGQRVAVDRPVWALRYLGHVPTRPPERREWERRAGVAAAYREECGYASQTDPIGPAPDRASPELRASWHAAHTALAMPELEREIRSATDGELLARRAAYQRQAAWAPPYVTRELREAYLAEDRYRAGAVLARHRAEAAQGWARRSLARQQALELSALGRRARTRRQSLEHVAEARHAWHEATAEARRHALAADNELRRRHPGIDLALLRQVDQHSGSIAAHAAHGPAGAAPAGRPGDVRLDIETALAAARHARQIIAEHRRQACKGPDLESDDLIRQRETQAVIEAEPRRGAVRQQPRVSRRAERSAQMPDMELEAGA